MKNCRITYGVRRGVATMLALLAFVSISRAQLNVVDSLGISATNKAALSTNPYKAQGFSTTVSGDISLVSLQLDVTNYALDYPLDVYIYDANSSGVSHAGAGTLLGTITPTANGNYQNYTVSLTDLTYNLTAGDDYAIVIDEYVGGTSDDILWEYGAIGGTPTGNGSFLSPYNSVTGLGSWAAAVNSERLMDVQVPEPTSMLSLGLGALALVGFRRNRRSK